MFVCTHKQLQEVQVFPVCNGFDSGQCDDTSYSNSAFDKNAYILKCSMSLFNSSRAVLVIPSHSDHNGEVVVYYGPNDNDKTKL